MITVRVMGKEKKGFGSEFTDHRAQEVRVSEVARAIRAIQQTQKLSTVFSETANRSNSSLKFISHQPPLLVATGYSSASSKTFMKHCTSMMQATGLLVG